MFAAAEHDALAVSVEGAPETYRDPRVGVCSCSLGWRVEVGALVELFGGQFGEPAFDQIDEEGQELGGAVSGMEPPT